MPPSAGLLFAQGAKAVPIVKRSSAKKQLPHPSEGFRKIALCHRDADVARTKAMYVALAPGGALRDDDFSSYPPVAPRPDNKLKRKKPAPLPKPAAKKPPSQHASNVGKGCAAGGQVVEGGVPAGSGPQGRPGPPPMVIGDGAPPVAGQPGAAKEAPSSGERRAPSGGSGGHPMGVMRLAFPSLSTGVMHFDPARACGIILEEIERFLAESHVEYGLELVLVEPAPESEILAGVQARMRMGHALSPGARARFRACAGNITAMLSEGRLKCNMLANAANWRLQPGGGGTNAAIFAAAGPGFQAVTKQRARVLSPGEAVAVPLPAGSPLRVHEGVTHVIHVLGPNMNPLRPMCLNGDYAEGCRLLRAAYVSLFRSFLEVVREVQAEQGVGQPPSTGVLGPSPSPGEPAVIHGAVGSRQETGALGVPSRGLLREGEESQPAPPVPPRNAFAVMLHAARRMPSTAEGPGKQTPNGSPAKSNGLPEAPRRPAPSQGGTGPAARRGAWADALAQIARNPGAYEEVLEWDKQALVVPDKFPKAKHHLLVIACQEGLDSVAQLREEHLPLLHHMEELGSKWAAAACARDEDPPGTPPVTSSPSRHFRLGFHAVPSMRQLHMHVVSQDFDSPYLKHKKHWNSFASPFFLDARQVADDVRVSGAAGPALPCNLEEVLKGELQCHRCSAAQATIPRLKAHIRGCPAPPRGILFGPPQQ